MMSGLIDPGAAFWRRAMLLALLPLAVLALPASAAAPKNAPVKYDVRHFTCPLGGKPFDQDVGYSTFPLITLPDGSLLGDFSIDAQIPVCPDNGLVILPDYQALRQGGLNRMPYHDYTPAEHARLAALIADPAYAALKADGRHAQAYWLATQLGRPAFERFELLLRGTWAARPAALRRRLVERLAADGPALIDAADVPQEEKHFRRLFIVNALRELGRFDDALALLEKVEAAAAADQSASHDSKAVFNDYAAKARRAFAEKDDGRFPVELLSDRIVNDVCDGRHAFLFGEPSATTLAACKTRRDREARESAETAAAFDESAALKKKPEELAVRCAGTPEDKRGRGLAMACEALQADRDKVAGDALASDGPKLAAACESTPESERKGALRYGCENYWNALERALSATLASDDAARAILCPGGRFADGPADRDEHVSLACVVAVGEHDEREASGQSKGSVAAPKAIDFRKRDARVALLEKDDAVFAHDCAREVRRRTARANAPKDGVFDIDLAVASDDVGMGNNVCAIAADFRDNRKTEAEARAKGLMCLPDARCMSPADYAVEEARNAQAAAAQARQDAMFSHDSSLSIEARARAAAIIARAKADGTYQKRRPGELE